MKRSIDEGKKYISPTYGYLSMKNFAMISELLDKKENAAYYKDKAEKMRDAFAKGIITEDGKMPVDVMGAYIIPLHYGLVPDQLKDAFVSEMITKIDENNGCLDTGFLGTPVILDTLCENGYQKKAYDILFQDQCPSWLYEVDHGATTIWESWISAKPDGTPLAVSLNHYAFGCVDDWMFRNIGGIVPEKAGYKSFRVEPRPDPRITSAARSFESEYGTIRSEWKCENGTFTLNVTIPANTEAEIVLPDGNRCHKGSGTYTFTAHI